MTALMCLQAIPSNDYAAQSEFKAELRQAYQVVPDVKGFFEEPDVAACLSDPQVPPVLWCTDDAA